MRAISLDLGMARAGVSQAGVLEPGIVPVLFAIIRVAEEHH